MTIKHLVLNKRTASANRQILKRPTFPFQILASSCGIGMMYLCDLIRCRFIRRLPELRDTTYGVETTHTNTTLSDFNDTFYSYRKFKLMTTTNSSSSQVSSYLRSVNDYTLSSHQLFADAFGSPPKHVLILNLDSVPHTNADAFTADIENFAATTEIGLTVRERIGAKYINDNATENDNYTVYRQIALAFSDDNGNDIVIEMLSSSTETTVAVLFTALNDLIIDSLQEFILKTAISHKTDTKTRKDRTFYTISSTQHGYELEDLSIKYDHTSDSVIDNYNDDFTVVDNVIQTSIAENKKGLMLLHGAPGSGKTSYIKHLITSSDKRRIVYIPTHLSTAISSPSFISFVKSELSNAVLVIEDAEQVLMSRESNEMSRDAVSNILNMTDGILADALNLLIICTFNSDMKYLDKALLRKGRLLLQYEFSALKKEKADALCMKLYDVHADSDMLLSEIYNLEYDLIRPKEKVPVKFGFTP